MPHNLEIGKEQFAQQFNVSRETMEKLENYRLNLEKWAHRINLVSLPTLRDFWIRHAADSAQLINAAGPNARNWIDFGSGAGFPGLIIATLLAQNGEDYSVRLVDTNIKRCAFLAESARILGVSVEVLNKKANEIVPIELDIVTARAFTSLSDLLDLSLPYYHLGARLLFLKGETVHEEVLEASTKYRFGFKTTQSIAHKSGQIIEIMDLSKINDKD